MRLAVLVLCAAPAAGAAACPDLTVLSCTLDQGEKRLQMCQVGNALTYRYGANVQPAELALTEPLANGTYTPWTGVGSAIWESARFNAKGYIYETWASADWQAPGAPVEGGVNVVQGAKTIAALTCDPGSVQAGFTALFAVMENQGYCYDRTLFGWATRCD